MRLSTRATTAAGAALVNTTQDHAATPATDPSPFGIDSPDFATALYDGGRPVS